MSAILPQRFASLGLCLAMACGPSASVGERAAVDLPERWSAGDERASGSASVEARSGSGWEADPRVPWWDTVEDAELQGLVDRALRNSPRTRAAWERVSQARALETQAGARRWPWLDATFSATRRRQILTIPPSAFGPGGGTGGMAPSGEMAGGTQTFESEQWSATLDGSWQPDLFGGTDAAADAAGLDVAAARASAQNAQLGLAGEVARAWYELVGARAQRQVLADQLELADAYLDLVAFRFERGLANSLELLQQREQMAATRARFVQIEGVVETAGQRLAVLVGAGPREDVAPEGAELPPPPPLPDTGVPADVVAQRPDVRAARFRVEAADERVGAAVAGRLPSIRLTGSVGYAAQDPEQLFEHVIYSGMATVTQPIFHGGELRERVSQNEAVVRERLAEYADTVLQAMLEVEGALANERHIRRRVEVLETRVAAAREALTQARFRYTEGLTDFLPVLEAQRARQEAELQLVDARTSLLTERIALYRALGGTWVRDLEREGMGGVGEGEAG